ncbi:MAG: DnaD domain protein [Bacilli bacterium]|nr:DnaD domain protein [Bacilli bacterium]
MDANKLINIMKSGSINVPLFLVRHYQEINLDAEELIIISYLVNKSDKFDINYMSNDLNISDKQLLQIINQLQEKDLLSIEVNKNDKGIMEEYLSFDVLYNKLALILLSTLNDKKSEESSIFQLFEEEFVRTLSPIEYEIINGWLESNYKEEIIIAALKEAVYNGAKNLRYIDRILFEWHKKGINKLEDIEKEKALFRKQKKEKIEIPDYNWLEEEE